MELQPSSLTGLESSGQAAWAMWVRRGFLVFIAATVVVALTGRLGVHSADSSGIELGWSLRLHYAQVARPGLDVPWEVTVDRAGGFSGPVTLAITGSYFDIYETQGFHPQPSDESRDGDTLYLTFAPPDSGGRMVVAYDAYIQPASQQGAGGSVSVLDHGKRLATVPFRTRLLP